MVFWLIVNYREAYNIFASNGILFNHESPRRGETFVTKKITRAVARIITCLDKNLSIGNLDAKRDWGYAPEYCEGMWRILNYKKADDFVLATSETHTVKEFIEYSFNEVGISIEWKGSAENEKGIVKGWNKEKVKSIKEKVSKSTFNFSSFTSTQDSPFPFNLGDTLVTVNPNYYRPTEVDLLIGNAEKAKNELGWQAKTKFSELVRLMIKADVEKVLRRGY